MVPMIQFWRKNNIETFKNKSSILQLILNYKIAFII